MWLGWLPPTGGQLGFKSSVKFGDLLVPKWPEVRRQQTRQFGRNVLEIREDPQMAKNETCGECFSDVKAQQNDIVGVYQAGIPRGAHAAVH